MHLSTEGSSALNREHYRASVQLAVVSDGAGIPWSRNLLGSFKGLVQIRECILK